MFSKIKQILQIALLMFYSVAFRPKFTFVQSLTYKEMSTLLNTKYFGAKIKHAYDSLLNCVLNIVLFPCSLSSCLVDAANYYIFNKNVDKYNFPLSIPRQVSIVSFDANKYRPSLLLLKLFKHCRFNLKIISILVVMFIDGDIMVARLPFPDTVPLCIQLFVIQKTFHLWLTNGYK